MQTAVDSGRRWLQINGDLLNLSTFVFGLVAAYFLTIQSLRVELSAKASAEVVQMMDQRLARIEVLLQERTVSKEYFYEHLTAITDRLTRIEGELSISQGGPSADRR